MDDTQALVLLNMISGPALSTVRRLLDAFPRPSDIFRASRGKLLEAGGRMAPGTAGKIIDAPKTIDPDEEIKRARSLGAEIITFLDARYPARLKEIYDFPPVLYVRGDASLLGGCMLAVVGSRQPSVYGMETCRTLCSGLALHGVGIISGLARGIDRIAHETALECGATTVAVLGCGLDVIYPEENKGLYGKIASGKGAVVSEFPIGTRPNA